MKKSTLITTIAMIVVVVVALSTATYAWFSSSTKQAVTTTIRTDAAEGWMLYGGVYNTDTSKIVYSSTTPLDMTLQDGLWSPNTTTAITAALSDKNTTTSFTREDFYSALYKQNEYQSKEAAALVTPNMIRALNNTGSEKDLLIEIAIVVGASADDGDFRAAAGFQTYIASFGGSAESQGTPAAKNGNTAYGYGAQSDSSTGTGAGYWTATKTDNAILTNLEYSSVAEGENAGTVDPTADNAKKGFAQLTEDKASELGVGAKDDYFFTITFDAGYVANGNAVNIAFYAWLDGWALDDTARGAQLNIVYRFYSAS